MMIPFYRQASQKTLAVAVALFAANSSYAQSAFDRSYDHVRNMERQQRQQMHACIATNCLDTPAAHSAPAPKQEVDIGKTLHARFEADMYNRLNSTIAISVNPLTGVWGAAVGGGLDSAQVVERKAVASCIAKATNTPFEQVSAYSGKKMIQAIQDAQCGLFKVDNYTVNAVNLFRTKLPDGSYRFYQATGDSVFVPAARHKEVEAKCKSEGQCELVQQLNMTGQGQVF